MKNKIVLILLLNVSYAVDAASSAKKTLEEYALASPTKHKTDRMHRRDKAATVLFNEKDCSSGCPMERRKAKRKTVERKEARECKQKRNKFE